MHTAKIARVALPTFVPDALPTLVSEKSICEWLGLSRQAITALVRKGEFPPSVRIGTRRKAWVKHEVAAWFEGRRGVAPDSKIGG